MARRLVAFLISTLAYAAAPKLPDVAPQVRSVFPLGGTSGESSDIRISGRNLEGVRAIDFARPDIRAAVLKSSFFSVEARVEIGKNVPAGLHHFRLRTSFGSHVGVFHVGAVRAIREVEPNDDPSMAQPVQAPALVDGVLTKGDYDLFKFHAEAGRTMLLDVLATRAGAGVDATVALLDSHGNEIDYNDDYYIHHDPHLSFTPKEAGDYFVRVGANGEGGSKNAVYRLLVGAVPLVEHVLPAGIRRGVEQEVRLTGSNLNEVTRVFLDDGVEGKLLAATAAELRFRIAAPASLSEGKHWLHAVSGAGEFPVPVAVVVSDIPEELSAAARRAAPQPVPTPVAVTGILSRRRQADFFSFTARAGDRMAFDVDAMKLGNLLDPAIAIYDAAGKQIEFQDEPAPQNGKEPPQLDPYLVHTFEKAGTYTVMIRDSAERGSAGYRYRLAIRPVTPDFELLALTPSATLFRGASNPLLVRVRRIGGWDTPVEVEAAGLPSGVRMAPKTAEPRNTPTKDTCGNDLWLDGTNLEMAMEVDAGAPAGEYPIRLRARGTSGGRMVEHTTTVFFRYGSAGRITGPTEDQALIATVTDLPRVLLNPPESVTLTPGKPARVRVLITRFDDPPTPLTVEPVTAVPGLKVENIIAAPGANQVELRLTAEAGMTPGSLRLHAGTAVSPEIELKMETETKAEKP